MPELKVERHTVLGFSLYVALSGTGAPLLMLPTVTVTHAYWDMVRPHLDGRLQLIMPDPLGGGRSAKPDRSQHYTIESQVELMSGLLDALGLREAHVMGAAFGGALALALAANERRRIRSVVVIEPFFANDYAPAWAGRMRDSLAGDVLTNRLAFRAMKQHKVAENVAKATMREEWKRLSPDERRALADAYYDPEADRVGWLNQLKAIGRDLRPQLQGLATPILCLLGELSTAAGYLERGVDFLKELPDARVMTVPHGAHDLHIQQPAKVAELALAFWREIGVQV